jgi:hypothetical protein
VAAKCPVCGEEIPADRTGAIDHLAEEHPKELIRMSRVDNDMSWAGGELEKAFGLQEGLVKTDSSDPFAPNQR